MTAHAPQAALDRTPRSLAEALAERGACVDAAAPIRAGMRARAIADACEQLAIPAILVDGGGRVLHVGAAAGVLMGEALSVCAGHLVGDSRAMNGAVARAVTQAIGGEVEAMAESEPGEVVETAPTITGLPYHDASPYQLLRGVLVLGRQGHGASHDLGPLRAILAA